MSTRRMLWTLSSEALRRGAGQLRMTRFPRCTPDSSSVLWGTRSTGGSGGRRLPHAVSVKAKGKRQNSTASVSERVRAVILCRYGVSTTRSLTLAVLFFSAFIRGRSG